MKFNFPDSLPLKKYIISFLIAFILTLIILAVVSIIFAFVPPSQWLLEAFYDYSVCFSSLIAALLCARACGKRGLLTGVISADIYVAVLIIFGIIVFKSFPVRAELLHTFAVTSLCGALGGIIGINCK